MRENGHDEALRSENIQKQTMSEEIQEAYRFNDEKNGYNEVNSRKYVRQKNTPIHQPMYRGNHFTHITISFYLLNAYRSDVRVNAFVPV